MTIAKPKISTSCTITIVAPPRGFGGSPLGFGGIDLIVIILWKCVLVNKFTGISTSRFTIIDFPAPTLTCITLKPL
jgi:hypothetical protein